VKKLLSSVFVAWVLYSFFGRLLVDVLRDKDEAERQ
jgi:hypothetical protein